MKSGPGKRLAAFCAAYALVLLLAGVVCAREDEDRWSRIESRNFLLVGNARERDLRKVAARLEQFREAFMRLLPMEHFDSFAPVTVMVFGSEESYRPFEPLYKGQPADVSGFFKSSQDVDYITLSFDDKTVRNPYQLAFHEYAHLLVRNGFSDAPLWFNEGLAEYYSTFEVSGGNRKVTLGKPIATRQRVLRERPLMPLRALFGVTYNSEAYFERDKRTLFYAQSWALVHYLLSGPRRSQLSDYLRLLSGGSTVEDAFARAFRTDFEGLEKELAGYVTFGRYPEQTITFDKRLEAETQLEGAPLTEAETQFYLGDLLLHTERLEAAEGYLKKSVELDPSLAKARASLGVLRMRQGLMEEAQQHLKAASAADTRNYLVHYHYAYALSRVGAGSDNSTEGYYDAERAALMRAELGKVIELAPGFAEAYRLLAFVNLVRDERLEEAIVLLRKAIGLAPRRHELVFLLAQVHLRRDEFDAARAILKEAVRARDSEQARARAESLLAAVAAREEFIARVRALEAEAKKEEAPPKGPLQPCDAPQPGPQLKKLRFEGQQVCGQLVRVDCADDGVALFVEADGRTLKLHSEKLGLIRFVTYTAEVKGQVTCGVREPANPVLVTYRPTRSTVAGFDGEVIAVEFVPREWNANH